MKTEATATKKIAQGKCYQVLPGRGVHFPHHWRLPHGTTNWAVAGQIICPQTSVEVDALAAERHKVFHMSKADLKRANRKPVLLNPAAHAYVSAWKREQKGNPVATPESKLGKGQDKRQSISKGAASQAGGVAEAKSTEAPSAPPPPAGLAFEPEGGGDES